MRRVSVHSRRGPPCSLAELVSISLFDGPSLPLCPAPFGFIFPLMLSHCAGGSNGSSGQRGALIHQVLGRRQGRQEQDWPSCAAHPLLDSFLTGQLIPRPRQKPCDSSELSVLYSSVDGRRAKQLLHRGLAGSRPLPVTSWTVSLSVSCVVVFPSAYRQGSGRVPGTHPVLKSQRLSLLLTGSLVEEGIKSRKPCSSRCWESPHSVSSPIAT